MRTADLLRLLLLAAIWGASFLFMRMLAPALGALWTTELRVAIAACVLIAYLCLTRRALSLTTHARHYLVIGFFNSALPFTLFAYAALTLPAGYSAILNATTPLWGALLATLAFKERLTLRKITGLLIGIAGVALLVRLGPAQLSMTMVLAVAACLLAAFSYGVAGVYSKKKSGLIGAPQMATGSQLAAALILLPLVAVTPLAHAFTPQLGLVMLGLALLCTALAYLLFFRLIADVGATKALTVTFLIPLFALLWAWLFLHETVTVTMLLGCALVVLAMWLVVFQRKA